MPKLLTHPSRTSEHTPPNHLGIPDVTKSLLAPIKVVLTFSLGTYALFVFGPWDYPMAHDPWLTLAVAAFNLSMYMGFRVGISQTNRQKLSRHLTHELRPGHEVSSNPAATDKLMTVAFVITLVTFPLRLVIGTQNYGLDMGVFLAKVTQGLSDASVTYSDRAIIQPPGIWVYLNYLVVLTGFISWLYTPLAILLWHRIGWIKRSLAFLVCLGLLMSSAARGQNFGAFDVLTQVATFLLIRSVLTSKTRAAREISPKFKAAVVATIILIGMASFFANTMRSRVGDQYTGFMYIQGNLISLKNNNLLWNLTPPFLQPVLATLSLYMTHAYAALSMAIGLPFTTTYGLGSSYFLLDNVKAMTGIDLFKNTFQYKLENGQSYDSHALWHTAYVWIANDVSLIGVPIFLFVLFFIFGRAWRDLLVNGNLVAGLMMAPLAAFTAFISASNQISAQPNALFAFWVLLWALSRRKIQYTWIPPMPPVTKKPRNQPKVRK